MTGGTAGSSANDNGGAAGAEGDACDGVTCENGGTCKTSGGTFKCECVAGYDGKYCQNDVDDCASAPCLHGGTCTDGLNEYACDCGGTGYFGDRCEVAHFEWLGGHEAVAYSLSGDGQVVVRSLNAVPARWTRDAGFVALEANGEPIDQGRAYAANADGSVIAGIATLPNADGAFRWTLDSGLVSLQLGYYSEARGVSANGIAVAGTERPNDDVNKPNHAFRWTTSAGTEELDSLGANGSVQAMNADGTVLVGRDDSTGRPFRWTRSNGLEPLGVASGIATAVSGDGKTVVGTNADVGKAFVYTGKDGYVLLDLGTLTNTRAYAVNGDGSVITGAATEGIWVWDKTNGVRLLLDLVQVRGVDLAELNGDVYAVSTDGTVFTGEAYNGAAYSPWIARL